jgi:plasmid maintenance system killer protein
MKYLLLVCLLPLNLLAAELRPFRLEYELSRGDMALGKVKLKLDIKGDRYDFSSESKASGLAAMLSGDFIQERSQGRLLANNRVEPLNYSYHHTQGKSLKADTRISFDASKARIERHKKEPRVMEIPAQTQDQLSAQLLLIRAAASPSLKMTMLDGKRLHSYQFQAKGQESIKVPAGSFKALHFQRKESGKANLYDIWLSTDAKPIPLLIQQQEKSGAPTYSLRLLSRP